jgi:hypothetical protein
MNSPFFFSLKRIKNAPSKNFKILREALIGERKIGLKYRQPIKSDRSLLDPQSLILSLYMSYKFFFGWLIFPNINITFL